MKDNALELTADFAPMNDADLKKLGIDEVCYIKKYIIRGKDAWVLHAADGNAIGVQDNADAARNAAQFKELDIVTVH